MRDLRLAWSQLDIPSLGKSVVLVGHKPRDVDNPHSIDHGMRIVVPKFAEPIDLLGELGWQTNQHLIRELDESDTGLLLRGFDRPRCCSIDNEMLEAGEQLVSAQRIGEDSRCDCPRFSSKPTPKGESSCLRAYGPTSKPSFEPIEPGLVWTGTTKIERNVTPLSIFLDDPGDQKRRGPTFHPFARSPR
jgi:hypothetical protein